MPKFYINLLDGSRVFLRLRFDAGACGTPLDKADYSVPAPPVLVLAPSSFFILSPFHGNLSFFCKKKNPVSCVVL